MTIIYGILNLPLYFSNSWEFFAFFRVLAGTGLGATIPMVTTCFSEWVPSKNRSFFITFGMAFMICGWLLAGVIGGALSNATAAATINEAMVSGGESAWRAALDSAIASAGVGLPFIGAGVDFDSWRYGYFIGAIPIVYGIVLWFAMPETPHWYASKGRFQDVNAALGKLEKSKFGNADLSTQFAAEQYIVPKPVQGSGVARPVQQEVHQGHDDHLDRVLHGDVHRHGHERLAAQDDGHRRLQLRPGDLEQWRRRHCRRAGWPWCRKVRAQEEHHWRLRVRRGDDRGHHHRVLRRRDGGLGALWRDRACHGAVRLCHQLWSDRDAAAHARSVSCLHPRNGVSYCQAFGRFGGALGPLLLGAIMDFMVSIGASTAMSMSVTFMVMTVPAIIVCISTAVLIKGDFKGAIDEITE